MTQVLIAVDDSDYSVNAAKVAYALFGDTASYTVVNVAEQSPMMWGGDSLVWGVGYPIVMAPSGVVHAVPASTVAAAGGTTDPGSPGPGPAVALLDAAPIDAAMQVALDVATEADLPNPQVVGEAGGDPAAAIIAAAHHHQADVIVIGSHERSWLARLFIPSVAGNVLKDADIPVLIAR
jgi:nucleotide-binding universal stress UspA family protein